MTKSFLLILMCIIIVSCAIFLWQKNSAPIISVDPQNALLDKLLEISISNLKPQEQITLELSSKDKDNNVWRSHALFKADDNGIVYLAKQAPAPGSYSGIDPMGLFWSMKPTSKDPSKNTFLSLITLNLCEVTLSVFSDNKLLAQTIIHRQCMPDNVERKEIRKEGIVGTLFYPKDQKKNPGVIAIPGSGGIIPEHIASLLAAHGYTVLALAYFGYEGLPENLSMIPLEYFQKAMEWLKKQPQVNENNIAIMGHSRGGEAVLLLASLFPKEMDAVIAFSSPHLVYGDFLPESKSAWTYKNKPLPFMPYPSDQEISKAAKDGLITLHKGTIEDPFRDSEIFLYGMKKDESTAQKTAIPVENIRCPLLIISGDDDAMWPSATAGKKVIERLDAQGSTIEKKHLNYSDAGHNLFVPPYLPALDLPVTMAAGWSLFGGTPEGNACAQKESWHEMLKFLKKHMKSETSKQ